MNPDTRLMLDLQAVDLMILDLQRELDQIPGLLEQLQQQEENLNKLTLDADAEVKGLEHRSRELEGEVESLRAKQRRLKQQQMEVKTNKEYQAILGEIDYLEKEIVSQEDAILELMEKAETSRREAERNKRRFAEDSTRLIAERKRLTDSSVFLGSELAAQKGKREELARNLPARILATYNRLSGVLGGVALSEARDEICQVCHVRLRPQMYQEIRTSDALFQCEACSRILYFSGD